MAKAKTTTDEASWQIVQLFLSSNGKVTHTVRRNTITGKLDCSCQGFRVYGKGYCKHTKQIENPKK